MRQKGGYDLEKQQDLEEGEAAAKSIMIRADEAVQKEHHAAAVNELQSRVEDWKGHKINHFGELLHFGTYTVLKGEGAKVVEREVSVIFDSLDSVTRAMVFSLFMHSLHRGNPKSPCSQSWTLALQSLNPNSRGKYVSDLPSVSGHPAEEHPVPVTPKTPPRRSKYLSRRKPPLAMFSAPSPTTVEPLTWSPSRFISKLRKGIVREKSGISISRTSVNVEPPKRAKTPEEHATEILQNALQILKIGTGLKPAMSGCSIDDAYLRIMDWSHNTPFKTQASKTHPSKALTPLQFLLRKSILRAEHLLALDGAFKSTTLFLFCRLLSPEPFLSLAATIPPVVDSEPISDMEKEIADDLAIKSLVRIQYKVYLFERILLCCNEINPNKPKNKVLAKQNLVDKKGKPKLQLKGRIFMQNVTDVVTLSKHSTRANCHL